MDSRSRFWLVRFLAVLAALSLLFAACTDDDDDSDDDEDQTEQTDEALDEDDYVDEFNEICGEELADDAAEFEESAQSVGQDPEEGAELIRDFLDQYGDSLDDLRALQPPEDLEEDLDELFEEMEDFAEAFEDLADAVEEQDEAAVQEILGEVTPQSLGIQEELEDLDLDCGEVFAQMSGSDSDDFSDASDFSDFTDASDFSDFSADSSLDFSDFTS